MIRDRGNIKWVSLMLPEHVQQLKKLTKNIDKIDKPILDEQTYEQFNEIITEATTADYSLAISYYENGSINQLSGKVNKIDTINNKLQIISDYSVQYNLKFKNIIAIEQIDEE